MSTVQLLKLVTDAIQSQERLANALKAKKKQECPLPLLTGVVDQALTCLDSVRGIKSQLEGSTVQWTDFTFSEDLLLKLRQLTLMHVPSSLNDDVKQEFRTLLENCFKGKCKMLLFASLVTCPWYQATQEERGQQAKHNVIVVVFSSPDVEYFCPIDLHKKEANSVIDLGWLYAVEVSHFAHYLCKGKARFLETLFTPESAVLLLCSSWERLKSSVNPSDILSVRGFIEECRGQAAGGLGRKKKSGQFKMRDDVTLRDFCNSCRLLQYASQSLNGKVLNFLSPDVSSSSYAEALLEKITALYKDDRDRSTSKREIFDLVLEWKTSIDKAVQTFTFSKPDNLQKQVGNWLSHVRLNDVEVKPLLQIVDAQNKAKLRSIMDRIGGHVSKMAPEQILMVAQAGSFLYNLSTPESDVDYVVIYAHEPMVAYSSSQRLPECFESRGPTKSFEYGAYEARLFCEMLWKGSVVILELLFADNLEYTSKAWQALADRKSEFVTETAIRQYLGLIKNNMVMIEGKKHIHTPRERKLFYQIFHKLYSLGYMLNRKAPPVRCTESEREFIMKIRKGPLEGDLCREALYDFATEKIAKLKDDLAAREERLSENVDPHILTSWIMDVRGWPCKLDS